MGIYYECLWISFRTTARYEVRESSLLMPSLSIYNFFISKLGKLMSEITLPTFHKTFYCPWKISWDCFKFQLDLNIPQIAILIPVHK